MSQLTIQVTSPYAITVREDDVAAPGTTDCEPAFARLPAAWRATAAELGHSTQDAALAFALRKCAGELAAALPTP